MSELYGPEIVRQTIQAAAADHGFTVEQLLACGSRPRAPVAWARHDAAWRLSQFRHPHAPQRSRFSSIKIANYLGRSDHTTALNSINRWGAHLAELAAQDARLAA